MTHVSTDRRRFLQTAAALAAATVAPRAHAAPPSAAATPGQAGPTATPLAPFPLAAGDVKDWSQVRALFKLDPAKIHMTGLLFASHPKPVRDAIERYRDEFDLDPVAVMEGPGFGRDVATHEALEKYLGAQPNSVAITDSTTQGLGLVYGGIALAAGDEVVQSTHDHYSTDESLRLATSRAGAVLTKVALYDDGAVADAKTIVARLTKAITAKTKYVALTWVHSSTGVKLPVRAIADALAKTPAKPIFVVDGVHGFGNQAETAPQLGCDLFIAGTHKWLWGPRGTGLVWGNARGWAAVSRVVPPFDWNAYGSWMMTGAAPDDVSPRARLCTPGGFKCYEHRWAVAEAARLHDLIGKKRIADRIATLATRLKKGLAPMKHVKLHTPMDPALSGALVTFDVNGKGADDVVKALHDKKIVASSTPYKASYARITPSAYNTEAEIDAVIAAVAALA